MTVESVNSSCVTVLGAQWGNEGKGKIVEFLSRKADVCARFNGGSNNIHTISLNVSTGKCVVGRSIGSIDSTKTSITLGLFPLGVSNKACKLVFGNGMVLHLPTLLREISAIQSVFDPNVLQRMYISTRAHIVFDFHQEVDGIFDGLRGGSSLGTTRMGAGPAYSTKTIRNGLRLGDLFSERNIVREKIAELALYFTRYNTTLAPIDVDAVVDSHLKMLEVIRPCIVDTVALMSSFRSLNVVCEGANSFMSDVDFGTYPYVTSSNTTSGSACIGLGIPPTRISSVIGVCKAYTTRAQHWFPSGAEMDSATAQKIATRGNEISTVDGSVRRVGWLDLVQVKYACGICGFDELAITKLGVLCGLDRVGIVTKYVNWDVERLGYPATDEEFKAIVPLVEYVPGWSNINDENAKRFIAFVERFTHTRVMYVQVGDPETVLTDADIITI